MLEICYNLVAFCVTFTLSHFLLLVFGSTDVDGGGGRVVVRLPEAGVDVVWLERLWCGVFQ